MMRIFISNIYIRLESFSVSKKHETPQTTIETAYFDGVNFILTDCLVGYSTSRTIRYGFVHVGSEDIRSSSAVESHGGLDVDFQQFEFMGPRNIVNLHERK